MDDIAKISVWIPDLQALTTIAATAKVVANCGAPRRDGEGNYVVAFFGPLPEIQKIAALSFRHQVDETFGQQLKAAQAQVSKIDRFQGGKIKPEGLGIKR
jgi:hypothetical protein